MFDRRLFRSFDFLLLLTVIAILLMSLVVISSVTMHDLSGDSYYVQRQAMLFGVGFIILLVIVSIDYTIFYRFTPYLYGINLLMLLAVLFLGSSAGGAQRWIELGFFRLQPSEFAKFIIIISLARHMTAREGDFESLFSPIPFFAHVAIPMGLIFMQPDLGTSLVFIVIVFGMLFMAGAKLRHLAFYAIAGAAVGLPLLFTRLQEYQRMRLFIFLNPDSDPLHYGYQLIQSMIAVGSGGVWGKGLFADGTQIQLDFLPEQHTDFIFSALAEQLGFVGAIVLLVLYLILIFRILRIGANAKDTFGMLICFGVASMLVFQVLVNIGMSIGMMPVTGLPLPFMSYGGSSLLMNMMAIGLVLNIGMRRHRLMFGN
ncbi:rod shape-determining protein RodA [Dethiobacter alkaliphilus]|uniref:rod shape-determining protein RodA n=1 Tax=Dethiobacter alkaliphilus TaxID=427926 RepID=UPI002226A7CC|nr:rod shape-determining protein RodA [Dethiobacter alkaliphilus]MCW3491346.1 rod shape-determining protein RodA [Dethiobacter alkaliphilus]